MHNHRVTKSMMHNAQIQNSVHQSLLIQVVLVLYCYAQDLMCLKFDAIFFNKSSTLISTYSYLSIGNEKPGKIIQII